MFHNRYTFFLRSLYFKQNITQRIFENTTKRNVFFQSNIIILRTLQIFGILTIEEGRNGATFKYERYSLQTIYSISIYFLANAVSAFTIWQKIESSICLNPRERMSMVASSLLAIIPLGNIFMILEVKKIANYFKTWHSFQENFHRTTGKVLKIDMNTMQIFYLCLAVLINCVATVLTDNSHIKLINRCNPFPYRSLLIFVFAWAGFQSSLLWGFLWFAFKTMRVATDQFLQAFLSSHSTDKSIRKFRHLWQELWNLTTGFNHAFGGTFLWFICCGVAMNLICSYIAVIIEGGRVMTGVILCILAITYFTSIPEYSHRTIEKVTAIRRDLLRLKHNAKTNDEEMELSLFENIVAAEPRKMSFYGYFAIDRGFITTVYLSIAQAMIIIYQLQEY